MTGKRPLDANLAAILDSIRATVGGEEQPTAERDHGAEPAAEAEPAAPRPPQQSVEEFFAALIRPQVKAWLDANLPELVQKMTADEIRRLIERG